MTRPFPSPGLNMRHQSRPPVDCRVCAKPIEKPGPLQKVHAGECHREWNRRNSEKFHAKQRKAKARKKERARVGAISGRKPLRNAKYLAWIRTHCCLICSKEFYASNIQVVGERIFRKVYQESQTEACHTGPHAFGRKSSDLTAVPLCGHEHHREGKYSYHRLGEKRFEAHHGISIAEITSELRAKYAESRAAA